MKRESERDGWTRGDDDDDEGRLLDELGGVDVDIVFGRAAEFQSAQVNNAHAPSPAPPSSPPVRAVRSCLFHSTRSSWAVLQCCLPPPANDYAVSWAQERWIRSKSNGELFD